MALGSITGSLDLQVSFWIASFEGYSVLQSLTLLPRVAFGRWWLWPLSPQRTLCLGCRAVVAGFAVGEKLIDPVLIIHLPV